MKTAVKNSVVMLFLFFAVTLTAQTAKIDEKAPDFTLTDSNGEEHSLSDFEGKYVVLEWINFGCPFVQKHYNSGNMQALQEKYTGDDVVWLAINSSAEGKQGYHSNEEINAKSEEWKAKYTAYLIDTDGSVGKAYGAKTTPHMYIIDPEGTLIYAGGIDDKPSTEEKDIKEANNYVAEALDAAMAGEEVPNKVTKPYGCSVKY